MSASSKNVAVFGSTGSIGRNALEVIAASEGRLKAVALSAHGKLEQLLEQARQFLKVAGVTGIVLTKLDGTAKGGIAVAIANELSLPIRYAGIGEKVDDLVVFDPELYVNGLFE